MTGTKAKSQMVRVPNELLESVVLLKQLHREGYDSQIAEGIRQMAYRIRARGLNHFQQMQLDRIEQSLPDRDSQQQLDQIEGLLGSMRSSFNTKIALIPAAVSATGKPKLIPAAAPVNGEADLIRRAIAAMNAIAMDSLD